MTRPTLQTYQKRLWNTPDYVYVHLMKRITLEETLNTKRAYEKILSLAGHTVKSYRTENGRIANKGFLDSRAKREQTLTFCRVGAHNQNGIVENRNKHLTLGARSLLLQGMRMRPQMNETMFWPYALKAQAEPMNCLHLEINNHTPNKAP